MIFSDINGRHYAKMLNVLRETIVKIETRSTRYYYSTVQTIIIIKTEGRRMGGTMRRGGSIKRPGYIFPRLQRREKEVL